MSATILFADNTPRFLEIRKQFLEAQGYRVIPAYNPSEAKEQLATNSIDLAILDIRMVDDDDDTDLSGFILAKQTDPDLPKIFLTGYPTWEEVCEALGPNLNGLPLAVDFIAKKEGPDALLQAVDLALNKPRLRANILNEFQVPNRMALSGKIQDLSTEETATRMRESFNVTAEQLRSYRDQANKRATQYHNLSLLTALIGICLIIAGVILIFVNKLPYNAIFVIAGAISQAASTLFINQQKLAYQHFSQSLEELHKNDNLGNLITVCDTLIAPKDREGYRKKILDKLIEKM